ncbi:hypothetical protein ACHQM5_001135 [Ranunculus cassubicifolius]
MAGISSSSILLTNVSPFLPFSSHKPSSTLHEPKNTSIPNTKTPKKPKFLQQNLFPQSIPIHTKNPSSNYKHIQNFARQNKLKEAITILDYLEKEGISVNPTTFSSLIEACIRQKSLLYARQIHTYIRINGLDNNEFLRTKLVQLYSSCGSMEDAEKVFDELSTREVCVSVYAWNALLRGNVVHGGKRYGDVLATYMRMKELDVEMNEYSYSCLIKSIAGSSAISEGLRIHAVLIKNGFFEGSIVVQTSLIDMYFKCGRVKLARQVFEKIPKRDIVVYGTMIAGFSHNRLHKEALECLRLMISEGIELNSVILTSALPVIGELCALRLAKEVHGYAIKRKGYVDQKFIQSGLIDVYCKCGNMASGREVFYGSIERNAISWTALISGYISNGRLGQALRSMIWMQQEGVKPDVVTIATVLPVCAELKALKQGKEIHCFVIKSGFLPNVSLVTSLIVMYSQSGCLDYSCKLFDGMERRNVISWTAMIDSYLKNNCLDEALEVFRSMQLSKHRPDSVAISRILSVCAENAVYKLGKEMHAHILKKNFTAIPFVSAEIVKMYGRCGELEKAKILFRENPSKGSMMWTAIIEAYAHNNMYWEAVNLYNEMISSGVRPNHFTFREILTICDRAGFVDDAVRIFNSMSKTYKIKPVDENYDSIIGLLTRLGHADEAQRYVQMRLSMA